MSCDALVANTVVGLITLDVDYKKAKGSSKTPSNSWGWTFCYKGDGSVKKKINDVTMSSRMVRIRRQVPFLQSLVRQAKGKQCKALLQAANADQINAVSEMVLNVLTNDQFPVRPDLVARLRPHKKALRELRKKKNSLKRRREILLKQKGGRFWNSLDQVCRCLNI